MTIVKLKLKERYIPECTHADGREHTKGIISCPVHGDEAFGGINNRIAIQINEQIEYHKRGYTNLSEGLLLDGHFIGVVQEDKVWVAAEKTKRYEVHLIRDGVKVTFSNFSGMWKAHSFVFSLIRDANVCENAFTVKLGEQIKSDASTDYNQSYSDFLCDGMRDSLAISNDEAIKQCEILLEILKARGQKKEND